MSPSIVLLQNCGLE